MKIKIKVTKEILWASRGCQAKTMDCVIARACREIFPDASVLGHSLFLNKGDCGKEYDLRKKYEYIELPDQVYQFTKLFDVTRNDAEVMKLPLIQFDVDVPESIIDRIGLKEVHKILSESKTLELAEEFQAI